MSASHPFFSIIVPTYNRAERLVNLIGSILGQELDDFEVIIIDDGSTDNTRSVVERFLDDERFYYHYQENKERAAARNKGALLARGQYLNFFDSDDTMYPNHLAVAYRFIIDNRAAEFFHTGYRVVNEDDNVATVEIGVPPEQAEERLITTNYLGCNSVFIERQFFLSNPFNDDRRLASSEDWELWLRLISRKPLYRCDIVTFEMHNHQGRSLNSILPDRIVERDTVMLQYLFADEMFLRKFNHRLNVFEADRYTFFALVYSLTKGRTQDAMKYLMKSLGVTPKVLARRRFWASFRHTIFAILKGRNSEV